MPIAAEARVRTDRPGRYLTQLCKHFSNKGRHLGHRPRPHGGHLPPDFTPDQVHVEWSDTRGVLSLPWGRCVLDAEPGVLVLRAEADDQQGLRRLQDLLSSHIGRFGRREELRLEWQQLPTSAATRTAADADVVPALTPPLPRRRSHLTWAGIAALVVLFVAVHLGLAGAVLSAPRWTGWAAAGVLALLALKITAFTAWGRHARAARRSRPPR